MAGAWQLRPAVRRLALGTMLLAASGPALHPLAEAHALRAAAVPPWPGDRADVILRAQGASGAPPVASLPSGQAARIALFSRLPDAEAMALVVPDRARFVAALFELRDMVAAPGPFDRARRDRIEADMALREAAAILREARRQRGALDAPGPGFACAGDGCAAAIPAQAALALSPPVVLGATAIFLLVMSMGRRVLPWMIGLLGVALATALAVEAVRRCWALARVMVLSCARDDDAPPAPPPGARGGGEAAGTPPGGPEDPDPVRRRLRELDRRLGEQKRKLDDRTLDAARRELRGEVVSRRRDGTPFDHVQEVRDSQNGLRNIISAINRELADPRTSLPARRDAERILSEASRLLDRSELFVPP